MTDYGAGLGRLVSPVNSEVGGVSCKYMYFQVGLA